MAAGSDSAPRRAPVTRERVLAEALRIADEDGVAALSMRRLGRACGVEAMSLYHHVPDKDTVLDGITAAVIAEVELPDARDLPWDVALAAAARAMRDAFLRHPGALSLLASRPAFRHPEGLALIEWLLRVMRGAGFTPLDAMYGTRALGMYVIGYALGTAERDRGPGGASDARERLSALDPASYPTQAALIREVGLDAWDDDDLFELGLRAMLDGLRLRLDGQPKTSV
ncbi:MAG: TetR/AcrR family transcriptional regulator C-terminal domain-containing protein [Actinomycetes bacterium]